MSNLKPSFTMYVMIALLCCIFSRETLSQTLAFKDYSWQDDQETRQTLNDVLKNLESRYNINFTYRSEIVQDKYVDRKWQNEAKDNLEEQLTKLLTPFSLIYKKAEDRYYLIYPKTEQQNVPKIKPTDKGQLNHGITIRQTIPGSKSLPRRLPPQKRASSILEKTITGKVTDENNESLPGVNILVRNTSVGTVTDVDGNYRLTVSDNATTLVFSSVGYLTEEVSIGNQNTINVQMLPDIQSLSEVVVIGYGTQKKSDLTGSISSISGEDIQKMPVTSLDQALQGRAPGVQITQTSGQPGGGVSVRIRGSNSITAGNEPLYVIDGMPIYNDNSTVNAGVTQSDGQNPLATINPQNIESIEVLKDASATAIYGARGANGVVIITTKQGRLGENRIDFDASFGIQEVRRKMPILNARQFAEFSNEAYRNGQVYLLEDQPDPGAYAVYTEDQVNSYGKGTDWQDELFRPAPRTNYGLSFSGGNENTKYSVSGSYFNQQGTIINSDFKRAMIRVNLDQKLTPKISIGNNIAISRSWSDLAYTGAGFNVGASPSIVLAALGFNPILPVRDPETGEFTYQNRHVGEGNGDYQPAVPFYNPIAYATQAINQNISNRVLGSVYGEYNILENLKLRVNLGVDLLNNKQNHFVPSTISLAAGSKGEAAVGTVENFTITNENIINYRKTWGTLHSIDVTGGFSVQRFYQERLSASAEGFSSNAISFHNLSAGAVQNPSISATRDWSLVSYLARVNYKLADKYLFTLTGRADGSSRFGSGNKFGYFPSGAIAWRVSEESFMQQVPTISNLKIRASYGLTGNQELPLYQSLSVLDETRYILDQKPVIGFRPIRIANPDLKWETTEQFDIGLDLGLFKQRLRITADYYQKNTRDLLLQVFLPTSSGFSSAIQNIGGTENQGVELAIEGDILTGEFTWNAGFNISTNRNMVTDLGDEEHRFINVPSFHAASQPVAILEVGKSLGNFYGWETDGFLDDAAEVDAAADQTPVTGSKMIPGVPRFVDQNDDGVVNEDDRTIIGNAMPDFIGGFSTNMSYKGFDLSALFSYSVGNEILNANRQWLEFRNGRHNNTLDVINRWSPEKTPEQNRNAETGLAINPNAVSPFVVYDRWIEDGSYLRLNNIQLSYNIPTEKLGMNGIRQVRIYVSGQNLLTFTNYGGFDPEVNRFGQDNILRGFDVNAYPISKTYLVGINIGL
uniref:TonB-dependent receptor n=1 Tax=Roseihalotalea indica TaxID=2867963 RepID=A0AA49GRT7_9BACT|nr:TonB-dependent receptor [Tunicatimonas sp. TK19036]